MEYLFIYLMQLAGAVEEFRTLCIILAVVSLVFLAVVTCITMAEGYGWSEEECAGISGEVNFLIVRRLLTKTMCVFAIISALLLIVPTERTLAMIGGLYIGKRIVTSQGINTKLDKVSKIIDIQLDKYMEELGVETND